LVLLLVYLLICVLTRSISRRKNKTAKSNAATNGPADEKAEASHANGQNKQTAGGYLSITEYLEALKPFEMVDDMPEDER
jgi:hypothetical protein